MARSSDITPLLPWVSEPFRMEQVAAACRSLPEPFILRDVIRATGLPRYMVHERLNRMVKAGNLVRFKVTVNYPHRSHGKLSQRPMRVNVYAYRFVR